jgi:hypothetical protein
VANTFAWISGKQSSPFPHFHSLSAFLTQGAYSLASPKSRGAAQLVLTGDEEFVRIARLAAARHGMYLDEYGLWRWHSSEEAMLESQSHFQPNADAPNAQSDGCAGYWELVEGESEDRILDELELGAIAPQRRNFRFLTNKKRISARSGTLDLSEAELEELAVAEEDGEGRER